MISLSLSLGLGQLQQWLQLQVFNNGASSLASLFLILLTLMFFSSLPLSDLINSNYAVQNFFLRSRKSTSCICTSQILDFDWNLTKWPAMPETNQNRSKLYLRWNKGMSFQFAYWYEIFCPFRPNKNINISVSYSVKEKVNLF